MATECLPRLPSICCSSYDSPRPSSIPVLAPAGWAEQELRPHTSHELFNAISALSDCYKEAPTFG